MIDLSAAAAIAVGGAVMCMALKTVCTSIDAYDIGFEDGKGYMVELLECERKERDKEGEAV